MAYVLIVFYLINGDLRREETWHPDRASCLAAKQIEEREAKRRWLKEFEAYCILKHEAPLQ